MELFSKAEKVFLLIKSMGQAAIVFMMTLICLLFSAWLILASSMSKMRPTKIQENSFFHKETIFSMPEDSSMESAAPILHHVMSGL